MGFIKFMRTPDSYRITQKKSEWSMLGYIALHMRFEDDRFGDLQKGECFMSAESVGLTQREYRTAKKNLAEWNLVTFRSTNKNTIAKLVDSSIFDIGIEKNDKQPDKQKRDKPKPEIQQLFDVPVVISFRPFTEEFLTKHWSRWITFKKTQFKFVYKALESEQIAFNQLVELSGKSEEVAIKIIDQSIGNGWKGFQPMKSAPKQDIKKQEEFLGTDKYKKMLEDGKRKQEELAENRRPVDTAGNPDAGSH